MAAARSRVPLQRQKPWKHAGGFRNFDFDPELKVRPAFHSVPRPSIPISHSNLPSHLTRHLTASRAPELQAFVVRATRPYARHEEVFVEYGPKPNALLLADYGFVVADNPHDVVSFGFDVTEADPHREKKHQLAAEVTEGLPWATGEGKQGEEGKPSGKGKAKKQGDGGSQAAASAFADGQAGTGFGWKVNQPHFRVDGSFR